MTWTLLLYMAGDAGAPFPGPIADAPLLADLSRPLAADLARLGQAGSSPGVTVCVQYDSLRARQAFRWIVPPPGETRAAVPIGAVNTGEPASLSEFMGWAAAVAPADHVALILWGHGSGWSETDIYARYRGAQAATRDASPAKAHMLRRGLFASTAAALLAIEDDRTRAICYDDSARDFLDNAELRRALVDGAALMNRPRVDALGLDACLMTMLEVAAELRGAADYLVGSETVLPQAAWPWGDLLPRLHAQPDLAPRDVARLMGGLLPGDAATRAFVDTCQAALDLSRADAAVSAADRWSRAAVALARRDAAFRRSLTAARARALRLTIPREGDTDYVDLLDLLRVILREWDLSEIDAYLTQDDAPATTPPAEFRAATAALLRAIAPAHPDSLILGVQIDGYRHRPPPGGLSIYLPPADKPWSPMYERLAFSRTAWADVWAGRGEL